MASSRITTPFHDIALPTKRAAMVIGSTNRWPVYMVPTAGAPIVTGESTDHDRRQRDVAYSFPR
jgi:hypothetical protein